jgi:hypothetical protein
MHIEYIIAFVLAWLAIEDYLQHSINAAMCSLFIFMSLFGPHVISACLIAVALYITHYVNEEINKSIAIADIGILAGCCSFLSILQIGIFFILVGGIAANAIHYTKISPHPLIPYIAIIFIPMILLF